MPSETFYEYIANVFHPYLVKHNVKFPVILFLDGHKSHLNYSLSILCKNLQIELFALYPNSTRILQPCDVAVFRPLKDAWRRTVREWDEEHPAEVLNKVTFAPVVEKAIKSSIKAETLVNEGPKRKGKRNIERTPFAITSTKWQEMFRKKQERKETEEKEKEERKRKREEQANIKKNVKGNSQRKKKHRDNICFVCKNNTTDTNAIQCETCKSYLHQSCIPKKHRQFAIDNDDPDEIFLCHMCYKVTDTDSNISTDSESSIHSNQSDLDVDKLHDLYQKYAEENY
nr:unnamed protein product [Callosobruchus analis]